MGIYWTQDITVRGTKTAVTAADSGRSFYLEITSGENTFQSDPAGVVILGMLLGMVTRGN